MNPTTPEANKELRENYCFFCAAYGNNNSPLCFNCGNQVGTYPPEVEALLTKQADSLKQSLVAEIPEKRSQDIDYGCQDCGAWQGFNQAIEQFNTIINKVFNGRM